MLIQLTGARVFSGHPGWIPRGRGLRCCFICGVSAPARMGSHSSRKVRKRVESPICPDPCSSFCSPGFHVPTMLTICVMPFNNMRCVFQCPVFRRNLTKMCFSSGQICSKTSPFVLILCLCCHLSIVSLGSLMSSELRDQEVIHMFTNWVMCID